MSNDRKVTASSGNVFADLGFANPEEELLKAKLVREIRGVPSGMRLEFGLARSPGNMKVSFQAARSIG